MNITLNIEAGNPIELQEAITGLAGIVGGAVVPQAQPEKTKRSNSKSEKQPDSELTEKSDTSAPEGATQGTPSEETQTKEIPNVVELRAKAQEKGGTPEGKRAIKALLDEIGSKNITDIPEEKRTAFLARLEAL